MKSLLRSTLDLPRSAAKLLVRLHTHCHSEKHITVISPYYCSTMASHKGPSQRPVLPCNYHRHTISVCSIAWSARNYGSPFPMDGVHSMSSSSPPSLSCIKERRIPLPSSRSLSL